MFQSAEGKVGARQIMRMRRRRKTRKRRWNCRTGLGKIGSGTGTGMDARRIQKRRDVAVC
jgi:hypothetical protein